MSIDRRSEYDDRGRRWGMTETWTIDGFLQADDAPTLKKALNALELAYSRSFQNVILLHDNGAPTQHRLLSAWCWGGVHIPEGVSYPVSGGAEYASASSYRSYRIVIEGIHRPGRSPLLKEEVSEIVQWQETLSISGTGGPRFIMLQCLNGQPVKQKVAEATPIRAMQEGHAVGRTGYPKVPPPLFPGDEHEDQREVGKTTPQQKEQDKYDYPISWRYVFEAVGQLTGDPNLGPS